MTRGTKFVILGVVIVAVAGSGIAVALNRKPDATEVRIEEVGRHDLTASVTATGQVRPRTMVSLSSDITGRVVELAVKEGDMVSKGQFLLRIDPAQYEAAVQRAEAALASARAQAVQSEANAIQAERNLQRAEDMRKTSAALVSDEQLEQLTTQREITKALLDAARHSVDQALAGLSDAKSNLTKTTITAPMSGRITRLGILEGETAIMGTLNRDAATLLTISDMSVLETQVRVDETDVARIAVGDSALVEIDAFPDTVFQGRVAQIGHSAVRAAAATGQDQAVDYLVTVELIDPPLETRPDFSTVAKIVTARRSQALAVPIIALTVRERPSEEDEAPPNQPGSGTPARQVGVRDVEGVFVIGADNKVTFRPVKVGIAGEKHFEVLSGLDEGERIVAGTYEAIRSLQEGSLVRQIKTEESKNPGI